MRVVFSYRIFQALLRAFIATVETITLIGAHLIFVEIEADTYYRSASTLEAFTFEKCRLGSDGQWVDGGMGLPVTAVLPIHLYGMMVYMKPILNLGKNMVVVKDASQAHGGWR